MSYLKLNQQIREPRAVYYLLTFLSDFAFSLIFVSYTLFLLSKGLGLFEVNLVNLAFMLGNFIFEIPTGAYADYFGRKRSIVLSSLLMVVMFLVYFLSSNFIFFVIAELFGALATTFASGALDAWVVDRLEKEPYSGRVDFIFSQANIIGRFATIIGGVIGAYIASYNLAAPFGVGAVVSLIALMFALFFIKDDKPKIHEKISLGVTKMLEIGRDSINYGLKHPVVIWLVLSSALTMFAFMPLNMFWTPRLNELAGERVWLLGWVWAGFALFMMLGGYLVIYLLKKQKNYAYIMIVMSLLLSLPIVLISYSNLFGVVLTGFMVHEFARGMQKPIQKAYLNKHIPSDKRATILSFDSAVGKLGGAFGLIVLGYLGERYSISYVWMIAGVTLFLSVFLFAKAGKGEMAVRS